MGSLLKPEIGVRFGRLTVVGAGGREKNGGHRMWACRCDCGTEKEVRPRYLREGITISCGCALREHAVRMGKGRRKHGHAVAETAEYRALKNAKDRCHNPKNKQYANYGGRGIRVADEWRTDFAAFLAHIGPKPSREHTLERIDNSRGYEPGNVRWATMRDQINNTRVNHIVEVRGERMTLAQAIRLLGRKSSTVRQRLAIGWPIERALT